MLRRATDDIVIRARRPAWWHLALAAAFAAVVAMTGWVAYRHGAEIRERALADAAERNARAEAALRQARARIDVLEAHRLELERSLEQAARQLEVDRAAYADLSRALEQSTARITELRAELGLYRRIIQPENPDSGVQVEELSLRPVDDGPGFRYKLVLIQPLGAGGPVEGTVTFEVEGLDGDGTMQRVRWPGEGASAALAVRFRYFQTLSGVLHLPPDFTPSRIGVSVSPGGEGDPIAERWYPWPAA